MKEDLGALENRFRRELGLVRDYPTWFRRGVVCSIIVSYFYLYKVVELLKMKQFGVHGSAVGLQTPTCRTKSNASNLRLS